jgi:hypothetical protein
MAILGNKRGIRLDQMLKIGTAAPTAATTNKKNVLNDCEALMAFFASFSSFSRAFCTEIPIKRKLSTTALPERRFPSRTV